MRFLSKLLKQLLIFGFLLAVIYEGAAFYSKYVDPNFQLPTASASATMRTAQEKLVFDASMYPYYDQLDEDQKLLYSQMYTSANAMETTITPQSGIDKGDVETVFRCLMCDHPELFWLGNQYNYQYLETTGEIVSVSLTFNETADNIDAAKQAFDANVDAIVAGAEAYDSDYDKEKYVHDALIESTEYQSDSALNQSAYSAIVNHSTVCAGYAKSFQYLMQKLGIPCYYVIGTSEGEDHAWNIVLIDGSFYNVDVTWDDCSSDNDPYYFFNLDDGSFNAYHTRAMMSTMLPNCTSTLLAHLEDSDIYERIRFSIPK
jgi:Transglutaminase-like superfamily.